MVAMHMAMGDFLGRGRAHAQDLAGESERLVRQRVVAVEMDHRTLDLHHVVHRGLAGVI